MVHLQLRKENGERVLPVYYEDNYVSLLPGEARTVHIEAAEGSSMAIDGWNVARSSALYARPPISRRRLWFWRLLRG